MAPPAALLLDPKLRRHLQHDPIIRGGVADPHKFNSVKEYWRTRRGDVVDSLVPKGVVHPSSKDDTIHMLKSPAQAFIRRLIQIESDLADAGFCFSKITEDTFVADEHSGGVPMISSAAFGDVIPVSAADRPGKVDANLKSLADIIKADIIGTDNTVPVEVEDGLLDMMRHDGYERLYVILNHVSLVPLENRLDLSLRLFQHIHDIVDEMNRTSCEWVLHHLKFRSKWHSLVTNNSWLEMTYNKGNYATHQRPYSKKVKNANKFHGAYCQEWAVLKFNRNTSEHGLENAVVNGLVQYTRPKIFQMLYHVFPKLMHSLMKGLDMIGKLRELRIESLFVYC